MRGADRLTDQSAAILGSGEVYPRSGNANTADLIGCPGYKATDNGEILNSRGKVLRQWRESNDGAFRVRVRGRNRMVSYLVLSAFTGSPLDKTYRPINLNKNRTDNRLNNLAWSGKSRDRRPTLTLSAELDREYYRVLAERQELAELMQI